MADHEEHLKLTRAEAVERLKKAPVGSNFNLHFLTNLPVVDDDEHVFRGAGYGYVRLSRAEAIRIVEDLYGDILEAKGARVGLKIRTDHPDPALQIKRRIAYWIGGN